MQTNLKFPIGTFEKPEFISKETIENWIQDIENLPQRLKLASQKLNQEQLNTPYRPNGWTVGKLIHHIADSHINAYIRFKWTLAENKPTIKAYDQDDWAELADYQADVNISLNLISALHKRWVFLLKSLSDTDLDRSFIHPETNKTIQIKELIGQYAWHSNHHLAHIENLIERENW